MAKASKASRNIARRRLAQQERLYQLGLRQASGIAQRIRGSILQAWNAGRSLDLALSINLEQMEEMFARGMIAAHLQGIAEAAIRAPVDNAKIAERSMLFATQGSYDEAIGTLQGRLKLKPERIETLQAVYGNEAARVTRGLADVVERKVQKAVVNVVGEGMTTKQGIVHLRGAFEAAGISGTNKALLETLVRTQVQLAYGAGQYRANQLPVIDEILWGYEYVTAGDARVRPNHWAMEGTKLPKDDPFWKENWPPNGFSCRCMAIEIYDKGTAKPPEQTVMVDGLEVEPRADKGWRWNAGQVFSGIP